MYASRTQSRSSNYKPQTLIFDRTFTKASAARWAREHRYRASKVTVEKDGIHVRQHGPREIIPGTQATVQFGPHIRAIFARIRPAAMRRVYGNTEMDALAYNTTLAKLMQRLKRDAGATSIAQNYRGTGSQAFRRQLWVRFKSGAVIDLWLEGRGMRFGGVVKNGPPGGDYKLPSHIAYEGKTPEQVYAEAATELRAWANPSASRRRSRHR